MRILSYGREALLVEVESLDAAIGLYRRLVELDLPGVTELVGGARTVLVAFDPSRTSAADIARNVRTSDGSAEPPGAGATVHIPVRYTGIDLRRVGALTGLSAEEIVRRHTQPEYVLAFIGIAPGFYFLSGGDPSLQVPRRSEPHVVVERGSIALAGEFTGVYPRRGPGGWQVIGSTDLDLWRTRAWPAARLAPNTRVRFVRVDP